MTISTNPVLSLEHVSMAYGRKQVLDDVSVTLNQGEVVCILGESGVGKTTLFNVIAGLLHPDKGSVSLHKQDITGTTGHVSYMLQKDLLLPYKTVIDNASLPLRIQGKSKVESREEALKYFVTFGLEGTEDLYPAQLSGGMRQRVAFLRTFLFSDNVALLDEPFSALDTITKHQMQTWYLDIMSQLNLSTFFITHDIDEAILLSDRIYVLSGKPGKITYELIIDTPKPRNEDFLLTDEFINYKRIIKGHLNETKTE
ncbi:ABC transporter ATP-binding protein [Erysipelothrix amsterdamensis]|uniref:ABC transporter ATP-binding protein n=1 Tax=Erysipelothrix amsterdamensis TaxID=2929157 RepID=A0AAU9VHE2_9FIRM|nr:ABC transporter ATP-binding protein [Erysipelothrix sp. A18Y020d]CAH2761258.1 ABC transporter ATP-binding protein [Erysipelothrix sp. A18Y020d]